MSTAGGIDRQLILCTVHANVCITMSSIFLVC